MEKRKYTDWKDNGLYITKEGKLKFYELDYEFGELEEMEKIEGEHILKYEGTEWENLDVEEQYLLSHYHSLERKKEEFLKLLKKYNIDIGGNY